MSKLLYTFLFLALTYNKIRGDDMEEIDSVLQKHGITGLEDINKTAVFENAQKAFKEKCEKNGGSTAFDGVITGQADLQECVDTKLNASNIMDELNEAKKTGSMEDVFGKYCKRSPDVIDCINTFNSKLEQCLEPAERANMKTIINITESLTSFLCFKDGDRMAMFIAEGGLECLESKKDAIQKCGNDTIGKRIPQNADGLESITGETLPLLLFESQDCNDFDEFHDCTVEELEKCEKNHTPANIIDALFKFIRRSMPCKEPRKIAAKTVALPKAMNAQFIPTSNTTNGTLHIFQVKCSRHGQSPNAFAELQSETEEFSKCFKDELYALITGKITCSKMKTEVYECGKKVLRKVRNCVAKEEGFLYDFGLSSLQKGLDYVCEKNHFQEIFNEDGMACLRSDKPDTVDNCYKHVESTGKFQWGEEIVLTKEVLCNDFVKYSKCVKNYAELNCPHLPDFKSRIGGLLYAMQTQCRHLRYRTSGSDMLYLHPTLFLATIIAFLWPKM